MKRKKRQEIKEKGKVKKRPIIIDTDPGIDDALAIAIALFSEELDVKLITTVAGKCFFGKCNIKYTSPIELFWKRCSGSKRCRETVDCGVCRCF